MSGTSSVTHPGNPATSKVRPSGSKTERSDQRDKSIMFHSFGAPLFLGPELDTVYIPDFDFGSEAVGLAIPGAYTEIPKASLPAPDIKFISISHSEFMTKVSAPNILENLLTLSVDWKEWFYCPHPPEYIIKSYFPNLETLVMIVGSEENDDYLSWVVDQTEGAFEVEVESDPNFDPPELLVILDEPIVLE